MQSFSQRFRIVFFVVSTVLVSLSCSSTATQVPETVGTSASSARNVILFIADGGGVAHFTMGRVFARHLGLRSDLYLDPYHRGAVQTHSAKERVTDSASSATAYASGVKTYNAGIGVDTLRHRLPSVVDAAEQLGKATGLVVTSRITHATPASFSAHVEDRWMESDIADQQIRKGIDVLFGGGRRYFIPESEGGDREDGRNLLDEARDLGYTVLTDYDQVAGLDETPVLGLFESSHLPYGIDRAPNQVDLADLTRKAIDLLSRDEDGFFLMVEGSRIDHASHENDAAAAVRDVLDYDDAFRVALEFAQSDGETLVIAVSDHETGGLSLGRSALPVGKETPQFTAPTYWQSLHARGVYDWKPDVLQAAKASAGTIAEILEDDSADVGRVMAEMAGISDLTSEERVAIDQARAVGRLTYAVGEIVARRALVGWTTDGHTAADVNLYAFGPSSAPLNGNVDNTFIGRHIFSVLGLEPELISQGTSSSE